MFYVDTQHPFYDRFLRQPAYLSLAELSMKYVNFKQGSPEWLAWRNSGIGSSDAPIIADGYKISEKAGWMKSLDDLYQEKKTGISKVVVNPRMERGTRGEPFARAAFEKRTGLSMQPLCAEMNGVSRLRASFDGITLDASQTLEIKCPNEHVHQLAKEGKIVDYYVPQVVHQALVAWDHPDHKGGCWEGKTINFFSYVPETGDEALVVIPATDMLDVARKLYDAELGFLRMLDRDVPPCGVDFAILAGKYAEVAAQVKALEATLDVYKKALIGIAKVQDRTVKAEGVTVVKVEKTGAIDWKRLAADYNVSADEQAKYRKRGNTMWQVRASADDDAGAKPEAAKLATPESVAAAKAAVAAATQTSEAMTDPFWDAFSAHRAPATAPAGAAAA
ncbi:MAG TPA: YqaJ viral recombinase family protein [Rhodanobacteraceae bacterium]